MSVGTFDALRPAHPAGAGREHGPTELVAGRVQSGALDGEEQHDVGRFEAIDHRDVVDPGDLGAHGVGRAEHGHRRAWLHPELLRERRP